MQHVEEGRQLHSVDEKQNTMCTESPNSTLKLLPVCEIHLQAVPRLIPEYMFQSWCCLLFLQGQDDLTCYTFNTHQAKHLFCNTCGVQSFYRPRSNPDGYGVMPHCLDVGTVKDIKVEFCDGQNWEKFIANNPEIQEQSKKKD